MAKAKIDRPRKLKSGDYILVDGSAWLEVGDLVVYIYMPFKSKSVKVEIFPKDHCEDEDLITSCVADLSKEAQKCPDSP